MKAYLYKFYLNMFTIKFKNHSLTFFCTWKGNTKLQGAKLHNDAPKLLNILVEAVQYIVQWNIFMPTYILWSEQEFVVKE